MFDSLTRAALALTVGLALAACTVGPDHVRPDAPLPAAFVEAASDVYGVDGQPAAGMWASFEDPALAALIEAGIANNRDLDAADARLAEARALRGLEVFSLFPIVNASADANRSRASGRDPFVPPGLGITETYRAGFDASWEIDLFGGARHARERVRAEEAAAREDVAATRLRVIAEIAQAYFTLRAEQERLRVQTRQVANLSENLRLLELRRDAGRGTELDVARSNALGLAVASRLPSTEAAIARAEQRLSVLTAQSFAEVRVATVRSDALPSLPALVAVGTPAEWLARRPDVAAAERRLAASTAAIGIATAQYFPQLDLSGGFGWTGETLSAIGDSNAERFSVAPTLRWRFLDIGRVRQEVRASEARAAGALAAYQQSVLLALEDIETALAGYRATTRSEGALTQAVGRARTASELARVRFDAGAEDTLAVLDAERTLLDLEDQLASARAARATSLAGLYKALAGDFALAASATP